jgi:predicted esterase
MKNYQLLLALIFLLSGSIRSNAQASVEGEVVYYPFSHPVEFDQVVYKTAYQIDEVSFAITENLALRVYYPSDLEQDEKRPLVVLIHGGGFISGTFSGFFEEAEILAQLGYIAVSVQYRLCKRTDCVVAAALTYPCNVAWGTSLVPSSYAAAVDVQDAIEWLELHADQYHIDTSKIAVGGHSAGAITALNVAFMDQEEVNEICAGCGTWPDYLEGELEPNPGIKAVFDMSGAIYDTLWIDESESHINLMAIHGTHDGVVAYAAEPVYPCCNTYSSTVYGACPIIQRQNHLGGNSYLFTGSQFGHNVFDAEWESFVREQIHWFLAKSFFGDSPFVKHSEIIRSEALETCPPPFVPVLPGALCELGLSDTGTVIYDYPTKIVENALTSGVRIFPNPATNMLYIDLGPTNIGISEVEKLEVFDMWNRRLLTKKAASKNNYGLDISGLANGTYTLKVCMRKSGNIWERFLITR